MVKIKLNTFVSNQDDVVSDGVHLPFHFSFFSVYEKLQQWQQRFPIHKDDLIFNGLTLLYSLATKKFLDHRNASHLERLILSIHFMQKTLQRSFAASPHVRHLEIKWIPTQLTFPFSSKSVLGCLIGFNLTDRYELFDEENILLVLQKNHSEFKIVKESSYCHVLPNKNLKIIYFEIEKKDSCFFSLDERNSLESNLDKQIRGSFQKLAPTVFMRRNEEEVYKTILTLSREIYSIDDIPQAWISFEHQSQEEIVFLVVLVNASAPGRTPLHQQFSLCQECLFVSERTITVRHLKEHSIEAHIFRLHLPRDLSFVRSDGSLDFYTSRQKAASLIRTAIGDFRDYNGGSLIKQHELLDDFKKRFPLVSRYDSELMETFFYALTPLEKQALLKCDTLCTLFQHFLDIRSKKLEKATPYTYDVLETADDIFIAVKGNGSSWRETILGFIDSHDLQTRNLTYTMIDIPEGVFFHAVIPSDQQATSFIKTLHDTLYEHHQSIKKRQILRVGVEHALVSLDPRVGGDFYSSETLRLLFEGLTRFDHEGNVELGAAERIDISEDKKCYTFKLRETHWNDGAPVSAHDFEYSWKKILSLDFKTTFAYLFDPIKYAKEAKEGKVDVDCIGICALDERTLKVELAHPTPYFLELTAQPLYYPVRRSIDQKYPQWPYQVGTSYPCNGPFQLAVNDPAHQTYRLVRNPNYWDKATLSLDEVLMTQINAHQALQAFRKGELDWIGNPFGGWHPFYAPRPDERKISVTNASTCWFVFNTMHSPFHHDKIRQAFGYAINRSQLTSDTFMPLSPAFSALVPRKGHVPNVFFPQQDIAKAQQLLQEGLDELGMSKKELSSLNLMLYKGSIREEIALRLRQQLRDFLDIDLHLKAHNWNSLFSKLTRGDFDMCLLHCIPRINDPIMTLNAFRYAQEEINFSKWEDPLFQHWLQLSDQEADQSQRAALLKCAEEKICQKMPIIPLYYQPYQALVRQNLQTVLHHSFDIARSSYQMETVEKMNFPTTFGG
ncbi:MAG: peptide ABC transporter substrate-binding protein [Chlamydiales bacterium]|nr:peptide ABC transporter substrate-binding protein [Chlamydiales bacterium]